MNRNTINLNLVLTVPSDHETSSELAHFIADNILASMVQMSYIDINICINNTVISTKALATAIDYGITSEDINVSLVTNDIMVLK